MLYGTQIAFCISVAIRIAVICGNVSTLLSLDERLISPPSAKLIEIVFTTERRSE